MENFLDDYVYVYFYNNEGVYERSQLVPRDALTVLTQYTEVAPPNPPNICEYKLEDGIWIKYTEDIEFSVISVLVQKDINTSLNNFAQERGYSDIISACSYVNSTNEQYKLDATTCIVLRDKTWVAYYTLLSEINNNKKEPFSTYNDIKDLLPTLTWN
jgi:hypothetical protein